MSTFLSNLRKKTGSTSFIDSKYGTIDHWIDTGSLALNRIISGSIYNGIPSGKIIIIAGDSQSLKTILAINIAANALTHHNYDVIFYFDSELGGNYETFEAFGCDPHKVEHVVVDNVEDCAIKLLQTYEAIKEEQKTNPSFKALFILDSLGALVTNKLHSDADKGKLVSEMGGRAKLINSMIKGCTVPAAKTNCALLIINQLYDDPSAMFTQKIKNQSGGKSIQYQSTIALQCSRRLEKNDTLKQENYYNGSIIRFFTTKNRIIQPFLEAEEYISFSGGIGEFKYMSLFDLAIELGFIVQLTSQSFTVPSYSDPNKKFKKKDLIGGSIADEVWSSFIKDFDIEALKKIQYSKVTTEAIEELGFTHEQAKELLLQHNEEENDD